MRISFVLPRYHTNLNHWVEKHLEEGDRVQFLLYHDIRRNANCPVEPDIVPWSGLTRLIRTLKPGFSVLRYGFPDTGALKKRLKDFGPDLLVIRDPARLFSIVSILLAASMRLPFVLYTQAPLYGSYGSVRRFFIGAVLFLFRTVMITPVKGADRKKKALKRFFYIPFAMRTEKAEGIIREYHGGRMLMIGKYIPRKNHRLLIDAVARLKERLPLSLTIIGGTTGKGLAERKGRIAEYIREKGLESLVELKEVVPYRELQKIYGEYDLFVLPSRDEEVGVSVLEAMGHGLPVICSDTAGAADFIREGRNGSVFHSDDGESLARAVEYCLSDETQNRRMGKMSRMIVQTYYSPEVYYRRMKLLMEKVLRRHS